MRSATTTRFIMETNWKAEAMTSSDSGFQFTATNSTVSGNAFGNNNNINMSKNLNSAAPAIRDLAESMAASNPAVASELLWLANLSHESQMPTDAVERIATVRSAGDGTWQKLAKIVSGSADVLAPWVVAIVRSLNL